MHMNESNLHFLDQHSGFVAAGLFEKRFLAYFSLSCLILDTIEPQNLPKKCVLISRLGQILRYDKYNDTFMKRIFGLMKVDFLECLTQESLENSCRIVA